jgi:hypothetical protein
MSLPPFNKQSCHAMLNTLYPPVMSSQPTTKLTIPLLMAQRDGFFNYIKTVDKRGVGCLQNLMTQGAKEGEANGWSAVKRTLTNYLALANTMITECQDVSNMELNINFVAVSKTPEIPSEQRTIRKTDSGISFNTDGKHSKTPSYSSSKSNASNASRGTFSSGEFPNRGGSTLERIAREIRKIRPRTRIVVDEIVKQPGLSDGSFGQENATTPITPITPLTPMTPTFPVQSKPRFPGLRKMRSLGALSELKDKNSSLSSLHKSSTAHAFDAVAMRRQRDAYMSKNNYQ